MKMSINVAFSSLLQITGDEHYSYYVHIKEDRMFTMIICATNEDTAVDLSIMNLIANIKNEFDCRTIRS